MVLILVKNGKNVVNGHVWCLLWRKIVKIWLIPLYGVDFGEKS
jgi:hypothetical protein